MASTLNTNDLIGSLARQAGSGRVAGPRGFNTVLIVAALCSFAISVALVVAVFGIGPDFATGHHAPLIYKIVSMLMLSAGGLLLASRVALPGSGRLTVMALLPAAVALAFRAATDQSGLSVLGAETISVPGCILAILIASVAPLTILIGVLRLGAPTRPALAGAIAGMLAGALGATAYSLACRNDGGMFVAIWYPLAVLVVAALGAIIARRALAW